MENDNKFVNGFMSAIQLLVHLHSQPTMAKNIIKESGLTIKECRISQLKSGFVNDLILPILKELEQNQKGE